MLLFHGPPPLVEDKFTSDGGTGRPMLGWEDLLS